MSISFDHRRTWGPKPSYPNVLAYPGDSFQRPLIIAGPCSIEDEKQITKIAKDCQLYGVIFMRGGIFRAGTYPPENYGLQEHKLKMWKTIAKNYGLKILVEVIDLNTLEIIDRYADAFQVGARQMQNYGLLTALSNQNKPVTLKRHPGAKLDEFLGACEYLFSGAGTPAPILIERGTSTHLNHVRWDLSISMIAAIKRLTKIPVIVDASHGTGRRDLVEPMTYAGMAAGADGCLLEIHPDPCYSLTDAEQAIDLKTFRRIMDNINAKRF